MIAEALIDAPPLQSGASPADAAMERYADGDKAAFGELYDHLAPKLYPFLLRRARQGTLAEDLLQQTFLQMHHARGSFVRGARVVPWAFAIARRLAIDASRRGRLEGPMPEADRIVAAVAPEADNLVQAKQLASALQATFAALPESQRVAFELTKFEELSLAEVAEILGTTVTAVKLRVFRAAEALRAVVAAQIGVSR